MNISELSTPALIFDVEALDHNLTTMATALPGSRLRPHVKAHKCTSLARAQRTHGHRCFTCATPREVIGMVSAGLGDDLLLANEVLDPARLAALAALQDEAVITVAVDSRETIDAAATAGLRYLLIDVNVGLPRCGCTPSDAGHLADYARGRGLVVRGVMGYEGHLMSIPDRGEQRIKVAKAMEKLIVASLLVGGDIISAGGTDTYDLHDQVTEVQAGSYALMDTHYGARTSVPAGMFRARHGDLGQRQVRRCGRRFEDSGDGSRQPIHRGSDCALPFRRTHHLHAQCTDSGRRRG